tara:strand:- start:1730 stop:1843 length:114 start_codon:yes stop_codon:yes gene_type:complete
MTIPELEYFYSEMVEIGIIEECPAKKTANLVTTNAAY